MQDEFEKAQAYFPSIFRSLFSLKIEIGFYRPFTDGSKTFYDSTMYRTALPYILKIPTVCPGIFKAFFFLITGQNIKLGLV
jgi:hypothetical protein